MSSTDGTEYTSSLAGLSPRLALADEVYARLRTLIMESTIPPGTRINIEDAARRLAVSPTPVREALARLESDGLVEKFALRGYRTTDLLQLSEVVDLFDLRLLLEPQTAARAASRITPEARVALMKELEFGRASTDDGDFGSYNLLSSHDVRFHDLIFAAAGNELARQAYSRTHCHLHTFRLAFHGTYGAHTVEEHTAIADAIVAGDGTLAERTMASHIEKSLERTKADHPEAYARAQQGGDSSPI
ncbi:GntR family transcriptional regulator [Demequina oxidasica]|uniref:GntR family transcriptional regulator n=1 Tax=Demequina oxidasica TaxID=676199 RepID=UPI0007818734|nr:GntR family transcriptional regulator [Demequina oxidasica]